MPEHLQTSRHHIRKSATLLLFRVSLILFVMDTLYTLTLGFFFGIQTFDWLATSITFPQTMFDLWLAHTAQFFITVLLLGSAVLRWCRFTYYITDHELILHSGVIKIDEIIHELSDLHTVKIYQSWIGRIFNYGNVHITMNHFGHHEEIHLSGITDPKKYERIFREQTEKNSLSS